MEERGVFREMATLAVLSVKRHAIHMDIQLASPVLSIDGD